MTTEVTRCTRCHGPVFIRREEWPEWALAEGLHHGAVCLDCVGWATDWIPGRTCRFYEERMKNGERFADICPPSRIAPKDK